MQLYSKLILFSYFVQVIQEILNNNKMQWDTLHCPF